MAFCFPSVLFIFQCCAGYSDKKVVHNAPSQYLTETKYLSLRSQKVQHKPIKPQKDQARANYLLVFLHMYIHLWDPMYHHQRFAGRVVRWSDLAAHIAPGLFDKIILAFLLQNKNRFTEKRIKCQRANSNYKLNK